MLPASNLALFHAMLLSNMPSETATFIRKHGYRVDGRSFKLFSFSWPIVDPRTSGGIHAVNGKRVFIPTPFSIECTACYPAGSPAEGVLEDMRDILLARKEGVRVGPVRLAVSATLVENSPTSEVIEIKSCSPISVHTTKNGGKVNYLTPFDREFYPAIYMNLVRKHAARLGLTSSSQISDLQHDITLRPLGGQREQVALYKRAQSLPIKGWWGRWILSAPMELLETALGAGLGSRCGVGFGCIKEVSMVV